ncbi:hypothetical protein F4167_16925 [Candidatus Poribacteria bacterium]|nr:hypothetical protein [Candidatus Poribacteria bacterium]MYG08257.1 hypothetical protein [Candidatus Poribacteria bacterium]
MKRTLKSIGLLGIALLCCTAIAHIQLRQLQSRPPKKVYIAHDIERKKSVKKNEKLYAHLKPKPVDPQEQFLQTILDNNLFAPLGWQPTEKTPTYRLLGTHVPIVRKIDATAILQETTKTGVIKVVSIGTKLGADTVVFDIQPKQVVLKKGKQRITLTLGKFQFL